MMISAIGRSHRIISQACSSALWLSACLFGSYLAMGYDFRPGALGPMSGSWPAESALTRNPGTMTVVAFLHPKCPCSRATVTQLLHTLAAHPGAALLVPMFVPSGSADQRQWLDGEYAKAIRAAVPEAQIVADPGGIEAQRFGAYTSGTLLAYDARGREIFRGGITNRRGGEADNPGRQRFAQAMTGQTGETRAAAPPVFGCPLVVTSSAEPGDANGRVLRPAR